VIVEEEDAVPVLQGLCASASLSGRFRADAPPLPRAPEAGRPEPDKRYGSLPRGCATEMPRHRASSTRADRGFRPKPESQDRAAFERQARACGSPALRGEPTGRGASPV
jgi:hypothetical protein